MIDIRKFRFEYIANENISYLCLEYEIQHFISEYPEFAARRG